MFKIFKFFDFRNLLFDVITLTFALCMAIYELFQYKKTKQLFHKMYSLFFICISMAFIPFIILIFTNRNFPSIQTILFDLISVLFTLVGLFFYFRAERLQKSHNERRSKMRISKILIFTAFVWLLATVPWLLTRALASFNWVKYSLIFGTTNTIAVVIFLLVWWLLRKRFKVPSTGFSLAIVYLLLAVGLLIMGLLGQAKEPLIWEGVGPLIIMLCPLSMSVMAILGSIFRQAMPFVFELILTICFGGIFYFFLGKAFERFVAKLE